MAIVHQITSGLGTFTFTDHSKTVWTIENSPHKRPKDMLTGTDWTTGALYLVYVNAGQHVFEGEIVFLGRTATHPSRTLEDAQDDFNLLLAHIAQAEKYGPSGGSQGSVATYSEQMGSRTSQDDYTIVHGLLEEPSRFYAGDYIRSRLTLVCNQT